LRPVASAHTGGRVRDGDRLEIGELLVDLGYR
jgi:hypothetical protein